MEQPRTCHQFFSRPSRTHEARQLLLRLGRLAFGEPDAAVQSAIERLDDLPRLETCLKRLLTASSWQDLLAP